MAAAADYCLPSLSSSPSKSTWDEIDLSESYLVCRMFEEAASSASSIIRRMRADNSAVYEENGETFDEYQFHDIMESAGMVIVQAFNELWRIENIFKELESLYGSVAAIPGQVLLTGACIHIAAGHGMMLRPILEQFLKAWKLVDGNTYVLLNTEAHQYFSNGSRPPLLTIENYLDIIDVYIIQLLGIALHDIDFAISWTEKSDLPPEKQQELLQRLHLLYSAKDSSSSHHVTQSKNKTRNPAITEETQESLDCQNGAIESKLKCSISRAIRPCLWLFRTFCMKCENLPVVHQHGKLMLWSTLFCLICSILFKKRGAMQRNAVRHGRSIRKLFVDFWQLAFSIQVNPLAAVQPVSSPHGVW